MYSQALEIYYILSQINLFKAFICIQRLHKPESTLVKLKEPFAQSTQAESSCIQIIENSNHSSQDFFAFKWVFAHSIRLSQMFLNYIEPLCSQKFLCNLNPLKPNVFFNYYKPFGSQKIPLHL